MEVNIIEQELTCPICQRIFYHPVGLLNCLHTLCGSCAKEWFEHQAQVSENRSTAPEPGSPTFTCPVCRQEVRGSNRDTRAVSLIDSLLSQYPEKARSEEEKRELDEQYQPGDEVLPHVPQPTLEDRLAAEEDRQLMERVRVMSLNDVAVGESRSTPTSRRGNGTRRAETTRFQCETCNRRFNSQHAVNQHMNDTNHHAASPHTSDANDTPLRFQCETCDTVFHSQNAANQHMNNTNHWAPLAGQGHNSVRPTGTGQQAVATRNSGSWRIGDLMELPGQGRIYREVHRMFMDGWLHPEKSGSVQAIYLDARHDFALQDGYQYLFHGTQRACYIAESSDHLAPCNYSTCYVCSILRNSFKIQYTGSSSGRRRIFGTGIYTTRASSNADTNVKNHYIRSSTHVMLLCHVFTGRSEKLYREDYDRTAPSDGYDSVEAATRDDGGVVNYPLTAVYQESHIIPVGLIAYTREGWQPRER